MMKFLRRSKDLGINGIAARWYDKNSRNHRIQEMKGYANEVKKNIKDGANVLEVAPGPGYLSIELAKLGHYEIVGLDISQDFVEIAQSNARKAGVNVEFRQGNVSGLPFADKMFDFIICTAAFKNFKDPFKALIEMNRVLKPSASALIIDMNRNVSSLQLDKSVNELNLKGFDALFMKLTFKYFLKKGAYTKDDFINLISKTPFKKYDIKEIGIGLYVYLQK